MLFTEDNLENIRLTKKGNFKNILSNKLYYYHYACNECGYPYISQYKNTKCCSPTCRNKSEEHRIKNSISHSGHRGSTWKGGVTEKNIPLYDTYAPQLEPYEQCRRNNIDPNILEVKCTYCGKWYMPKRTEVKSRIRGIKRNDINKFYCDDVCRNQSPNSGLKSNRNGRWKGGYDKNNIPMYITYSPQLEPYEQCRRNADDPNILEVKCTYCGKWYIPDLTSVQSRIYYIDKSNCRFYCSDKCKQECPIFGQKKYPKGEKPYVFRAHQTEWALLVLEQNNNEYICEICGEYGNIAHHIHPVACNPIESADFDNGIIVCKVCHKRVHQLGGCSYNEIKNKKYMNNENFNYL